MTLTNAIVIAIAIIIAALVLALALKRRPTRTVKAPSIVTVQGKVICGDCNGEGYAPIRTPMRSDGTCGVCGSSNVVNAASFAFIHDRVAKAHEQEQARRRTLKLVRARGRR